MKYVTSQAQKRPFCGQCLMRLFWSENVATKLILKISVKLLVGAGSFWTGRWHVLPGDSAIVPTPLSLHMLL
jgi:hypothetical protein